MFEACKNFVADVTSGDKNPSEFDERLAVT